MAEKNDIKIITFLWVHIYIPITFMEGMDEGEREDVW
jgi:hypothetical protein